MFDVRPVPKRRTKAEATRRKLGGMKLEDVSEDNPKLAEIIKARAEARRRIADEKEPNFWVCLVFQSWDQKQEFLKAVGRKRVPTIFNGMYVDGQTLASALGIEVTPNSQRGRRTVVEERLARLVLPDERERAEAGGFG